MDIFYSEFKRRLTSRSEALEEKIEAFEKTVNQEKVSRIVEEQHQAIISKHYREIENINKIIHILDSIN